jgi:RNA polymerase sigma-70 factor, ECF subfamily
MDLLSPSQSPALPAPSTRRLAADIHAEMKSLRAQARRWCRSEAEAEDLLQDAVERALRFADTFEPGTNLRAWLRQVLRSVFITRCRRLDRERRALDRLTHDPCAWTHPDAPPDMLRLTPPVDRALASLPEKFRSAVRMVDLGGMSYREAADEMGVPVGTVMSRLFRARRMLATMLATEAVAPALSGLPAVRALQAA